MSATTNLQEATYKVNTALNLKQKQRRSYYTLHRRHDNRITVRRNDYLPDTQAFTTLDIATGTPGVCLNALYADAFFVLTSYKETNPMTSASEAARLLGSITSEKKAAASRENGRKGGRPRKTDSDRHKATAQNHGGQWYVHRYNESYRAMEELGPYTYHQARSIAKQINEEN